MVFDLIKTAVVDVVIAEIAKYKIEVIKSSLKENQQLLKLRLHRCL